MDKNQKKPAKPVTRLNPFDVQYLSNLSASITYFVIATNTLMPDLLANYDTQLIVTVPGLMSFVFFIFNFLNHLKLRKFTRYFLVNLLLNLPIIYAAGGNILYILQNPVPITP